jgi:hypothetical protein
MRVFDCQFEAEALAAALQSRWPERVNAELRDHVTGCPICSDVIALASAFDEAREETRKTAAVPDSGRIWRAAQVRARREDAAAAVRPITAAQVLALGCVCGVMGACFGATSTWFQALLPRVLSALAGPNAQALLAIVAEHGALVAGMAAITVLVPAVLYYAASAD